MKRRTFLQTGLAATISRPLIAALRKDRLDEAFDVLAKATSNGTVDSAVLHVSQRDLKLTRHFGNAKSEQSMFLLGSISKPISIMGLMTLFDRGEFGLDDPVKKFLPQFTGQNREKVTMRHLLTHVSGLPDQLQENNALRKKHAGLAEFAEHAMRTPLSFAPGTRYQYSSMAILLATQVAQVISGVTILDFVDRTVFQTLKMKFSAIGLGRFALADLVPCQTERAAPESGAGDPTAKDWDWNSSYWRKLGAPWGGVHASAPDVASFLSEFLFQRGALVKPETAKLIISNHNAPGLTPRGLGFNIGSGAGSPGCSEKTFGHTGSTGTLAWADPGNDTICVVLTSLPGRAIQPHPRDLVAADVASAAN